MRTTVDIPDDLYRQAEAQAAERGVDLAALIEEALRRFVTPETSRGTKRVKFPILTSRRPGTLSLEAIQRAEEQQILEEDRMHGGAS